MMELYGCRVLIDLLCWVLESPCLFLLQRFRSPEEINQERINLLISVYTWFYTPKQLISVILELVCVLVTFALEREWALLWCGIRTKG